MAFDIFPIINETGYYIAHVFKPENLPATGIWAMFATETYFAWRKMRQGKYGSILDSFGRDRIADPNARAQEALRGATIDKILTSPLEVWDGLTDLKNNSNVSLALQRPLSARLRELHPAYNDVLHNGLPLWYGSEPGRDLSARIDLRANYDDNSEVEARAEKALHEALNYPYSRNPTELWDALRSFKAAEGSGEINETLSGHLVEVRETLGELFDDILKQGLPEHNLVARRIIK